MWVEPEATAQVVSAVPVVARPDLPVVAIKEDAEAMQVVQAAQEQAVAEEGRWLSCVEPTFWRWLAVRVGAEEEATAVLPREWPGRPALSRAGPLVPTARIAAAQTTAVEAVEAEGVTQVEASGARCAPRGIQIREAMEAARGKISLRA